MCGPGLCVCLCVYVCACAEEDGKHSTCTLLKTYTLFFIILSKTLALVG